MPTSIYPNARWLRPGPEDSPAQGAVLPSISDLELEKSR